MRYYCEVPSPIGSLLLVSDGSSLTDLWMDTGRFGPALDWTRSDAARPFAAAKEQLRDYFAGKLKEFDVPLALHGSTFQRSVWEGLRQIPHGTAISYGELARLIGRPNASRAVGAANGQNPVAIIVPCHRVIGADGTLTGFGGGLDRKKFLLTLEGISTRETASQTRRNSSQLAQPSLW